MFSCGFNSGLYGGNASRLMLAGSFRRLPVWCHPAPSNVTTAWAPGATQRLISDRCRFMAATLTQGSTNAAPVPRAGQTAPKM